MPCGTPEARASADFGCLCCASHGASSARTSAHATISRRGFRARMRSKSRVHARSGLCEEQ